MSRLYRLSRHAENDLISIAQEIGSTSPDQACRVLDQLMATFQMLADFPEVGTSRNDIAPRLRMFSPPAPASSYIVFFYPAGNGIEVAGVIHSSRDWITMLQEGHRPLPSSPPKIE